MQRKFLWLYTYTLERTRGGGAPYGTALPLQPTTALMLRPLAPHCAQCGAPGGRPITPPVRSPRWPPPRAWHSRAVDALIIVY